MPIEIQLLSIARTLVEVAWISLIGQGTLALLAGERRHDNLFYRVLSTVTAPALLPLRLLLPKSWGKPSVAILTTLLLLCFWLLLAFLKHQACQRQGLAC